MQQNGAEHYDAYLHAVHTSCRVPAHLSHWYCHTVTLSHCHTGTHQSVPSWERYLKFGIQGGKNTRNLAPPHSVSREHNR
eukprot:1940914-Pyramimonas_sp.AAC.2